MITTFAFVIHNSTGIHLYVLLVFVLVKEDPVISYNTQYLYFRAIAELFNSQAAVELVNGGS